MANTPKSSPSCQSPKPSRQARPSASSNGTGPAPPSSRAKRSNPSHAISNCRAAAIGKCRYFSTLAESCESLTIAAAEHQIKSRKRSLSDQRDSFIPAEFLEFALRGEVKTTKLAHQGRQPVAYRLMEWSAVPACDFASRMLAVRKLARPAPTPVYQELVARGADRLSATMKRGTGLS